MAIGATSLADERGGAASGGGRSSRAICWDASALQTVYANLCDAARTPDEVVLTFGVRRAWTATAGDAEIAVSHRIVVSPFAAKRLALPLARLVAEHEARHGVLE